MALLDPDSNWFLSRCSMLPVFLVLFSLPRVSRLLDACSGSTDIITSATNNPGTSALERSRSLSEKQCSKRYASLVECKDANYSTTKSQITVSRLLRGGFRLQERILGQTPRASPIECAPRRAPVESPGSGVRGRGSGERETTASSLAGKQQAREKEDNGGQGKDGPAGAIAQGGNGR